MAEVNYILHLNAAFQQFYKDTRLNPTHVSLYMALFQYWNQYRFPEDFQINREEIMKMAKIGSKSTYHRNLKDLTNWKYIMYMPSHNPFKGSKVKMLKFRTSDGQAVYQANPNSGQAVGRTNKQITNNKNNSKGQEPKNENVAVEFFLKNKWPATEGQKFYNHYQAIGWKVGGRTPIKDWQASAKNWMLKYQEIIKSKPNGSESQNKDKLSLSKSQDNLHTNRHKDYNEPL